MGFVMAQDPVVSGLESSHEGYGYSRESETQEGIQKRGPVERSCQAVICYLKDRLLLKLEFRHGQFTLL